MKLYLRYIYSTYLLSKGRSLSIVLFIGLIMCLFSMIFAIHDSLQYSEQEQSSSLLVVNKTSPFMYLPYAYTEDILHLDDVDNISHATWVGGYFRNPSWRLPIFAVSQNYFALDDKISLSDSDLTRWHADNFGVALNRNYAEKFNIKIGDPFPIRDTVWNIPPSALHDLRVRAFVDVEDSDYGVYVHYKLLNALRTDAKNLISYIYVHSAIGSPELAKRVDALFAHKLLEGTTKTASPEGHIKQFSRQFLQLGKILVWVAIVIGVAFINILAVNFYLIAYRASSDYVTLNCIGFKVHTIVQLLLAKLLFISVLGGVLGLIIARGLVVISNHYFNHIIPTLSFSPDFYLYALCALFLLSLAASLPATSIILTNKKVERRAFT